MVCYKAGGCEDYIKENISSGQVLKSYKIIVSIAIK